jgi:hypothetical protein
MMKPTWLGAAILALLPHTASAQCQGWQHSGSLYILTTPEGADLPAMPSEADFPLLVRLDRHWFNFSQAKPRGEDIRFTTVAGKPLAYEVEQWDAERGTASVWLRIPAIQGNTRQEIKLYWGNANASSESNGTAVFSAEYGYATVLHMNEILKDELGSVKPEDAGTTVVPGVIGQGRHFLQDKGINGGDHITDYPYCDMPFSSEAWFRPETAGAAAFGWERYATRHNGRTGDGNEVVVNFGSPPSISWTSDGPGGVAAAATPVLGRWHHVAATYSNGTSRIYVNGKLQGSNYHKAAMSLMNDIGMTIGGLRGSFQHTGELEPETVAMLTAMGRCLDIIGEAVFSTRCWVTSGEDGIRFTRSKENAVLFATSLGWPNDELRIKTLSASRIDLKTLASVSLLGHPGQLTVRQDADGLTIKVTPKAPYESPAYAFKLTFTGQIPQLKE